MENIIYNIDSRFRDLNTYKNPGFFTYKLEEPLKNISYIRLSSIELPTVFYTFLQDYNNISFQIITNDDIPHTIIIEEGSYDSGSIISQIQTNLDIINENYGTSLTIAWNSVNYKVTFTNTTEFTLIFDNDSNHRSLGDRLGFRLDNTNYLAADQSTIYSTNLNMELYYWTGETFLDITKDDYLYLRINDYGVIYNDVRKNTLLAKVILYDQQFIIDTGANFLTKAFNFKQPINISKLEIELVNALGQTINMNLINYSLTLEFGRIFDSNQYGSKNFQVK
jgi:hypothetical protein